MKKSITFKDAATFIHRDQTVSFISNDSFEVREKRNILSRRETFIPGLTASFLQQMNQSEGFLLTFTNHFFEGNVFYKLYYHLEYDSDVIVFISAYIDEDEKMFCYFSDAYIKKENEYRYFPLHDVAKEEADQIAQVLEKVVMEQPCYRLRYVTGDLQSKW